MVFIFFPAAVSIAFSPRECIARKFFAPARERLFCECAGGLARFFFAAPGMQKCEGISPSNAWQSSCPSQHASKMPVSTSRLPAHLCDGIILYRNKNLFGHWGDDRGPACKKFEESDTVQSGMYTAATSPPSRTGNTAIRRTRQSKTWSSSNAILSAMDLTTYGAPVNRSAARNLRLKNCRVNSFSGSGAVFDEIVVDGLRTSVSPVILFGWRVSPFCTKGDSLAVSLFNRNISIRDAERK